MRTGNQISRAQNVAKLVYQGKLKLEDTYKISVKFGTLVESFYQEILMSVLSVIAQRNAAIGLGYEFGKEYMKESMNVFDIFSQESYKTTGALWNLSNYQSEHPEEEGKIIYDKLYLKMCRGFIEDHYLSLLNGYKALIGTLEKHRNSYMILDENLHQFIDYDVKYLADQANGLRLQMEAWESSKAMLEARDNLFKDYAGNLPVNSIIFYNSECRKALEEQLDMIMKWSNIIDKSYTPHYNAVQQALAYIQENK